MNRRGLCYGLDMWMLYVALAHAAGRGTATDWHLIEQQRAAKWAALPPVQCPRSEPPALLRSAGDTTPVTLERLEVVDLPSNEELCVRLEARPELILKLAEFVFYC